MISVAATVLREENRVLICRRAEGGSCPLLWEFPGGKLEAGETPEQCVVRECREELELEIRPVRLIETTVYRYPEREIRFFFFEAEILRGSPVAAVHREIRWVCPGEMRHYEFCPADVEIVEKIARTRNVSYHKLVRDRIPEIISAQGETPVYEILSAEEAARKLDEKLSEELDEYLGDHSPEELADLLEVLYAAALARGTAPEELDQIRREKAEARGGFDRRIFLKSVIRPEP